MKSADDWPGSFNPVQHPETQAECVVRLYHLPLSNVRGYRSSNLNFFPPPVPRGLRDTYCAVPAENNPFINSGTLASKDGNVVTRLPVLKTSICYFLACVELLMFKQPLTPAMIAADQLPYAATPTAADLAYPYIYTCDQERTTATKRPLLAIVSLILLSKPPPSGQYPAPQHVPRSGKANVHPDSDGEVVDTEQYEDDEEPVLQESEEETESEEDTVSAGEEATEYDEHGLADVEEEAIIADS
ncbi:hypothetical protein ACLMJK_009591 [Lecanora helva]